MYLVQEPYSSAKLAYLNKHMVSNHILNVRHLMKYRNTFLSYAELCDKYNCEFNIIDDTSILSDILWKNRLKEHDPSNEIQDHLYNKMVHKQYGQCKFLYNRFIKKRYNKIPISQLSWPNEFMNDDFDFQKETLKEIYLNVYFSSTCNKLRNFQLKLLHRCLPRKRILFNAKKCANPLCNFCKK